MLGLELHTQSTEQTKQADSVLCDYKGAGIVVYELSLHLQK